MKARFLPLALVFALGCRDWPAYEGAFNIPHALGVLHPEVGGPFQEPIGFVGNQHGGQIALLALKQGRLLTDDPTAAFLRGNQLATGQSRVLSGVVPFANDDATVDVFAFDTRFQQIVQIPYIHGFDSSGFPIEPETEVSLPEFDGAGTVVMSDVEIRTGWTATEDWVVEFDGDTWGVTGSRSGRMQSRAVTGETFVGVDRAIAFRITGDPQPGDRFTLSTDAHTVEYDIGGIPSEVRMAPAHDVASVIVHDEALGQPLLKLFNPRAPDLFEDASSLLPAVARPSRVSWSPDGADLFVADSGSPAAWHIHWDDVSDRSTSQATRIALPWPIADLAPLLSEERDQLFVAPLGEGSYWVYDLTAGEFRDLNPWVPGTQGITLDGPVRGLEAMPLPYLQIERNDDGVREFERAIAISLSSGRVVFANEDTGCLVTDGAGPQTDLRGQLLSTVDYTASRGAGVTGGPLLQPNLVNGRSVLGNPCAGVTRNQSWSLSFDQAQQGWEVAGQLSGVQDRLAFEDQRYVSDDGEVSFVIRGGSTPSQDGWRLSFNMFEGLTNANGDEDGQAATLEITLDQPGDPLYFHYEVGPRDQGWYPVDDRPHVLVAGESSDRVGRVDPQEGTIDATWD